MEVKYSGKAKIRVEGHGYLESGDVVDVPSDVGAALVRSEDFSPNKVTKSPPPVKRATQGAPEDSEKITKTGGKE